MASEGQYVPRASVQTLGLIMEVEAEEHEGRALVGSLGSGPAGSFIPGSMQSSL
jgi:hypothetical protein